MKNDSEKSKSLKGRRVVVTRPKEQSAELRDLLASHGADVLEMPLIEIRFGGDEELIPEILAGFGEYDWLVFTSANGVRGFFRHFFARYKDLRSLGPCRIACVGPATARAVEELHLEVDCLPETHTGDALAEKLLAEHGVENLKICVVTGNRNPDALPKKLEEIGRAIVDTFPVYATEEADLSEHPSARAFREKGADAIVFASGSAVKSFLSQAAALKLEAAATRPRVVAIGEPTASTLRASGIPVAGTARAATPAAVVEALIAALNGD